MRIIGAIISDVATLGWGAWVLATVWGWYIPQTFGLPHLSIPVAIGISGMVGLLTYQARYKSDETEEAIRAIVYGFLLPLWVLGICWVAKGFL